MEQSYKDIERDERRIRLEAEMESLDKTLAELREQVECVELRKRIIMSEEL